MAEYSLTVRARVSESPLQEILDLDKLILSLSRQYREVKELCDYLGRQITYAKKRKDELERQQTRVTICPTGHSGIKSKKRKEEDMTPDVADVLQGLGVSQLADLVSVLSSMMESDDEQVSEEEKS